MKHYYLHMPCPILIWPRVYCSRLLWPNWCVSLIFLLINWDTECDFWIHTLWFIHSSIAVFLICRSMHIAFIFRNKYREEKSSRSLHASDAAIVVGFYQNLSIIITNSITVIFHFFKVYNKIFSLQKPTDKHNMKLKSHLHRSVLVVNNVNADKKAQLCNPKTAAALEWNAVIRNVKSTEIKRHLQPFCLLKTFDNRLSTCIS